MELLWRLIDSRYPSSDEMQARYRGDTGELFDSRHPNCGGGGGGGGGSGDGGGGGGGDGGGPVAIGGGGAVGGA